MKRKRYQRWRDACLKEYKKRYKLRDNPLLGPVKLPPWTGWRDAYDDDLTPRGAVVACGADFEPYFGADDEDEG